MMEYIEVIDAAYKSVKEKYKNSKQLWTIDSGSSELLPQIISAHPKIKLILATADKIAKSDAPVLILGETGTGKELIAHLIHKKSLRQDSKFIAVNCGAIPETLLENELFGHEKGAFTGATARKRGLLEEANNGTIFFDEIAELSPALQAKLLRVIETGKFRRLGSNEEIRVNFRIISATNKNLYLEVQKNRFRADLHYRIAVITILLPPLRERKDDIPLLVDHFLNITNRYNKTKIKKISKSALKMLMEYNWPGNIRELKNCIERLAILCESEIITPKDIAIVCPEICSSDDIIQELSKSDNNPQASEKKDLQSLSLQEMEKKHIKYVYEMTNYDEKKTAKILGISEADLIRKLRFYHISKF
jgi:transcriptional regulator with PAS, ATPase and Fis domain